jgi:hypothetical protein
LQTRLPLDDARHVLMMIEFLKQPLFAVLVGLAFSLGFGPWLARKWQDHQRDRQIRTDLVSEMSRCVMSLVAVLERRHPGTARGEFLNSEREAKTDELAISMNTFDVDRCVIGTKLETYFVSSHDEKRSLPNRWTTFADELLRFSATSPVSNGGEEADQERATLAKTLHQHPGVAAGKADERRRWADESWGKTEQLFMGEKLDLLRAVRTGPMVSSARPPITFGIWFLWSVISLIAACVAVVGADLASVAGQPAAVAAWDFAAVAGVGLAVLLLIIGAAFYSRPAKAWWSGRRAPRRRAG